MSVVEQTTHTSKSPRRIPANVRFGTEVLTEFWTQLEDGEARAEGSQSVAGLLFGISEHDLLKVKALRPLPVSDTLENSPYADTVFEHSLVAARADPHLLSLQLVGWYRFLNPHNAAALSDGDLEFHNRRFRRATDIAVILKPKERGGISIDSIDLYGRSCANAALSNQDYRSGSLLLGDGTHFDAPKDVLMKESIADDYDLRVLQVLDSIDRIERKEAWKRLALRFTAIVPFSLRPKWMRATVADSTALSARRVSLPSSEAGVTQTRLGGVASVVFLVAFAIALSWFYGRPLLSSLPGDLFHRASANTSLNMRVEPQLGGTLLVKWDGDSADLRAAKSGSVQIDDGSERHDLSLDPNQIANGSILYTPVSKDLTFQLQVVKSDGTPITESIRIVNGSKAPLAAHVIASARPKTTVANTPTAEKDVSSPQTAADRPSGKAKPLVEAPKSPSARTIQAGPPVSNSVVTARTAPAKPVPATDSSPVAALRSANSRTARGPALAVEYIAPKPLKQVMPRTINPASLAFPGPTDVEVAVMIDDRGHVTEARMLDSRPYNSQIYTDAAISAALEWVFEPARKNGKSVPSQHTIRFHFYSQIAHQ